MKNNVILHIVHKDKFTVGYINFMQKYLNDWEHVFITSQLDTGVKIIDRNSVIYIKNFKEFYTNKRIKYALKYSNKIIISGIFGFEIIPVLHRPKVLAKTYLQFWGADFYSLRNKGGNLKSNILKIIRRRYIRKVHAWINLIVEDYNQLEKISGCKKTHYTAPVPSDPLSSIDNSKYINLNHSSSKIKVVVGNSATYTNCHIHAFALLERFKNENMEIYCPLSYGDSNYRDNVIKEGKRIFGNKFIPLIDFIDKEQYVKLLSDMDVGLFTNDRQQALGNITILLGLGKIVYLRDDTAMWTHLNKCGYKIRTINEFSSMTYNEIFTISPEIRQSNINVFRQRMDPQMKIECWKKIFEE